MQNASLPIGELLCRNGRLSSAAREAAIAEQQINGARLGAVLLSRGTVTPLELYRALAEQHSRPFIDLIQEPPTMDLLDPAALHDYLRLQAIPWRRQGSKVLVATAEPSPALELWAQANFGPEWEYVITSPRDILWTVEQHFAQTLDRESRLTLWRMAPHQSARTTLDGSQRGTAIALLGSLLLLFSLFPEPTLVITLSVLNIFYLGTLLLRMILFVGGMDQQRVPRPVLTQPMLQDHELPVYTLLIPLYKEAESLPDLLASLRALDYPAAKLDVKLIVEADDFDTYQAAKQLKPEGMFEILRVPYSLPRTKPKACNFALRFARGEYVTIYDAEDAPHPRQLRDVVEMFRNLPPDVACLQARLNYYNANDNLLTRLFAIEYGAWFDFMLPGLQRLDMPIPLGGTSNHVSLSRLRALGEWDPYNVTEDADLGVRLAARGLRTAIIRSLTEEEAPVTLGAWFKQRARWIKGYMQTWLVHMRRPWTLYTTLGPRAFWGFQFFVGGPCLAFLLTPFLLMMMAFWGSGPLHLSLPQWLYALALANLVMNMVVHGMMAVVVNHYHPWPKSPQPSEDEDNRSRVLDIFGVIAYPFYWLLHSAASFKALWQLISRPHHWDKTDHGLTRQRRQKTA